MTNSKIILLFFTIILLSSCKKYTLAKQVSSQVCADIQDYFLPEKENQRLAARFIIGDATIRGAVCDCFTKSIEKGLQKKYDEIQMQTMLTDTSYRTKTAKYLVVEYRDDVLECYGKKVAKLSTEMQKKGEEAIKVIVF